MSARRFARVLAVCLGSVAFGQQANTLGDGPVSELTRKRLPRWLRFGGEERARVELISGSGFRASTDRYLLNRLRFDLDIQATNWLKFSFEAQDSRPFGQNTRPAPASHKDRIDLRIGVVEIGSKEGPVSMALGRQSLSFGEGRVLADPNWSNVGRTFDGARMTLRGVGWKADAFSAVTVKCDPLEFNEPAPGAHFHGVYTSFSKIVPAALIEPYSFWRLEHNYRSEAGRAGNLDEKTFGVRWAGRLPLRFDYGVETAHQFGASAGDLVRSWASHAVLGYTLRKTRNKPRLYAEWNRASGDGNAKDGQHSAFDPLFPSTHDKLGITDLFTWTNLDHRRAGFEYQLRPQVRLGVAWNDFALVEAKDALYVAGKAVARSADGSAGTHVGQQADLQVAWSVTRSSQFVAGYGRLYPGHFLRATTAGVPYNLFFWGYSQRI